MAALPGSPAADWVRPAARWLAPRSLGREAAAIAEALAIEPLAASVLVSRGYDTVDAARTFLSPELNALHDPWLMRDMEPAVSRLLLAIRRREPVLLYGDYDVDGTCSIVVLKKVIEILGGRADFFIPHRLKDGYGMRSDTVERAAADGVKLIVSVDTGIRANLVVERARALGMDVIITDHHLPEAELPRALALLNPNRRDCDYPNKNLCGAGVTLKLVQALLARSDMPEARRKLLLDSLLKPVAIATVADIVPLTGENRVIVKRGLSGLRDVRNLGLRALMKVSGFEPGESPSAHQVAFRLAPRINAAGRMDTARHVIELLLTDDAARAEELAAGMDLLNRERQQTEASIVERVLEQCQSAGDLLNGRALVFSGPEWHLGVLGIVASRLVERFCRPVFVLSDSAGSSESGEPYLSGSGRSIPAFHLVEALESMPDLFARFGGHRQAAGLTLRACDLDEFRRRFHLFANDRLTDDDLRPHYHWDARACFPEFTDRAVEQVLSLGPFGFGNPTPTLLCEQVEIAGPPRVLQGGKHLTVPLRQSGRTLFCKAWGWGDRMACFAPGARVNVLLQIEDDPYSRKRGYGSWCVVLKDIQPTDCPN